MYAGILRQAYEYWFQELPPAGSTPQERAEIWFQPSEDADSHIRKTFGSQLDAVAAAAWPLGEMAREERVGLVILLDQFPRNIFRESAQAFAYDPRARQIAGDLSASNFSEYPSTERVFLILPFVHGESLADQNRAIALMQALLASAGDDELVAKSMEQAIKHRDLILRFGRFPHRNVVLGRASTPEEIAFAREHGRGY